MWHKLKVYIIVLVYPIVIFMFAFSLVYMLLHVANVYICLDCFSKSRDINKVSAQRAAKSKKKKNKLKGPVYTSLWMLLPCNLLKYALIYQIGCEQKNEGKIKNWRRNGGSTRVLLASSSSPIFACLAPWSLNLNGTQHPPWGAWFNSNYYRSSLVHEYVSRFNIQSSDSPTALRLLVLSCPQPLNKSATQHNSFNKNNVVNKLAITFILLFV